MNHFALNRFLTDAQLAKAVALDCARVLLQVPASGKVLLALSGGRIARRFCEELAEAGRQQGTNFPHAHFFWADERCVPPGHPESNFGIAQAALLGPSGIPPERIHRIQGELQPIDAANHASETLQTLASSSGDDVPVLDLILLGMGEDGHVASLFPGEAEDVVSNAQFYRPVFAPKPPPIRITMGYGVIAAAREVWVLASGSGKEAALRQSIDSATETPLGRVLASRAMTRILTDLRV